MADEKDKKGPPPMDAPPPGPGPTDLGPPGPPPGGPGMAPAGGVGDSGGKPYGAQLLEHAHQLTGEILKEFDGLIQTLENERVRSFLEDFLKLINATIDKAEEVYLSEYEKEHGPMPGAMSPEERGMGEEPEKGMPRKKAPPPKKGPLGKKPEGKDKPKTPDKKDKEKPKESEEVKNAKKKYLEARKEDILTRLRARRKDMGIQGNGTDMDGNGVVTEQESGSEEASIEENRQLLEQASEFINRINTHGITTEDQVEAKGLAGSLTSGGKDMVSKHPVVGKLAEQLNNISCCHPANWNLDRQEESKALVEEIQKLLTGGKDKETGSAEEEELHGAAEATFNGSPEKKKEEAPGVVKEKGLEALVTKQAKQAREMQARAERLAKIL